MTTRMRMQYGAVLAAIVAAVLTLSHSTARADDAPPADIVTTAVQAGSFNTLAAALQAAGLVDTLRGSGPLTVFAPTDEAFAKLPAGTVASLLKPENKQRLTEILTYHVAPGKVLAADVVKLAAAGTVNGQRVDIKIDAGKVFVDQARVIATDIACSNGVIHVIDQVLLPSEDNLPATAQKAGVFKTLLAAAKAADLVESLSGDQPLTVFAPTDDAFAKLAPGTVQHLLKPENKNQLAAILKYHVVAGRLYSPELLQAKKAKTLQGGMLTASIQGGKAKINNAGLVRIDLDASNGVIHVIDTVLIPPTAPAAAKPKRDAATHVSTKVCPLTGQVIVIRSASR